MRGREHPSGVNERATAEAGVVHVNAGLEGELRPGRHVAVVDTQAAGLGLGGAGDILEEGFGWPGRRGYLVLLQARQNCKQLFPIFFFKLHIKG